MERSTAWVVSLIVVCAFFATVALIYKGIESSVTYSEEKTERISTCIENGGSWVNDTEDCIAPQN